MDDANAVVNEMLEALMDGLSVLSERLTGSRLTFAVPTLGKLIRGDGNVGYFSDEAAEAASGRSNPHSAHVEAFELTDGGDRAPGQMP